MISFPHWHLSSVLFYITCILPVIWAYPNVNQHFSSKSQSECPSVCPVLFRFQHYGLCQAARQFWRKFVDTIKKEPFGFTVSPVDPCVLFKENYLGICIIIMYVDDMLIIGKKEQIQDFATMIQKEFPVKIQH